jgi:ribosomal protein S18 acetylase RimI-like enzyme
MNLVVRDAGTHDLPALRDVYRRAALSNENDRDVLLEHPDALVYVPSGLAQSRCRVATVDHQSLIGFATTTRMAEVLELEDLFVDPDWMRRGVGRALIEDVLVFAQAQAMDRVEVKGNPDALRFYERVGFEVGARVQTELGFGYRMHLAVRP